MLDIITERNEPAMTHELIGKRIDWDYIKVMD